MVLAEYVMLPNADVNAIPVPTGFDHEFDYLLLADIFPTAWASLTSTGFQPGDTVVVFGAGPVGLLCAYSAMLRGASRVYSIDHVQSRLDKAKSIGAIPINLTVGDPADQILKLEPNGVQRACDLVGFECVNAKLEPEEGYIVNQAIKLVASGGGIALTGVYSAGKPSPGEPLESEKRRNIPFPIGDWWFKGITITGGAIFSGPIAPALRALIENGRATPSFIVDSVISIDQAPEAYQAFSDHRTGKTVIRFFP